MYYIYIYHEESTSIGSERAGIVLNQLYQLCASFSETVAPLAGYQAGLNYMEKSMISGDLVVNYLGNSWKIHSSWWFIGDSMGSSGI